ncbi:MAG: orotate phosphoribosyltransferase [Armatimonadetes bacterium]|nr:orotate phosphoribosyltransferase [Armatimonadota bacterium]MDE2207036.1 orotate phosphoribosyltransferase [Armatimonadota bacterium]
MGLLTDEQVRRIFLDAGAYRKGHFRLTSGRHSDEYWEKFQVLQFPSAVQTLCGDIAGRWSGKGVTVVLGPTTGGILLALETARQLGVRALYAEAEHGRRVLRRGLKLGPQEHVLVVDDVLTMGGSAAECVQLVEEHGAELAGIAVLIDRSSGARLPFATKPDALLRVDAHSWTPETCPMCADGKPIDEPGSRSL